ncbi:MAG: hypothetical protein J6Y13_01295 [Treponema sp.]|nr:hypothetical protein [Treponema sp.]
MSRTYNVHTHKAPRDKRIEADNKGKKSRYRAEVRAALKDIQDLPEADEFYCDPMDYHTGDKCSSGYLGYEEAIEKSYFKEIISMKKSLLNGNNFELRFSFSSLDKLIIDAAMQKDSSFSGIDRRFTKANFGIEKNLQQNSYYKEIHRLYLLKGLRELSDEELKALVHKYVASKDGS